MTLTKAENRGYWLPAIKQPKEPNRHPPRRKSTGNRACYLALTFGTLLSSQGADAQEPHPHGLRSRLDVQLYAVLRIGRTPGGSTG